MSPQVTGLYLYPVKSCQGIAVTEAAISRYGLLHDRRWAIISSTDENHIENQYEMHPKLASIAPDLEDLQTLVLRAPNMPDLRIPLHTHPSPPRRIDVSTVQRTKLDFAEDEGDEAARWLTNYLAVGDRDDEEFRLVWCPPDAQRLLHTDSRWGKLMSDGDSTAFSDTAQYHIACEASLRDLNNKLPHITIDRFRPNIVVGGTKAWEEDHWRTVTVGSASLRVCMPDLRCSVTTVIQRGPDAGTYDRTKEPLATLRNMRKAKVRGGAVFGTKLNLKAAANGTLIRVGDQVRVEEKFVDSLLEMDLDDMVTAMHSESVHTSSKL